MSKYFLQTTPLRFFSEHDIPNKKILFLGAWCVNRLTKIDSEVLDYHWDDRVKLYDDYNSIQIIYEKYLCMVTDWLNEVHHEKKSVEYWRVIIGPWLLGFISIIFDRFSNLEKASREYDIESTYVPKYLISDWVPLDYVDFNSLYTSDKWNTYIYSELIKFMGNIPVIEANNEIRQNVKYQRKKAPWKKRYVKYLLSTITKLTPSRFSKIVFVESGLPPMKLASLLIKLKQFPISNYERDVPPVFDVDNTIRNKSISNNNESELDNILNAMIPKNIPITYLEGYKSLVKSSRRKYKDKVKMIFTSNAYFSNEYFKAWAAWQKDRGVKLLVSVHGGHHGNALFNAPGKLTEDIADKFYGWGWSSATLPSYKLSELKKLDITNTDSRKILFIPYTLSKYSNYIDSSPISSSFNGCIEMHKKLIDRIIGKGQIENLVIRTKDSDFGWDLKEVYRKIGVKNFVDPSVESIVDSISKSRLTIVTYDSTVILEALTLNVPTLLFYRKEYWEMNDIAKPLIDELVKCKVIHYHENSLSEHIQDVFLNISEWWNSQSVQLAVTNFLDVFGRSSITWKNDWANEFRSEQSLLR